MKKKIDGKIYNTEKSHKVAEVKALSDKGYFFISVQVQAPEDFKSNIVAGDTFIYFDFILSEKHNKIIPTDVDGLLAFESFVNNEHITTITFDGIYLTKIFDSPDLVYLRKRAD